MADPLFELHGNPEGLQRAFEKVVAALTGLPLDRATKILRLGEPWPDDTVFEDQMSRASHDARELNLKLETAIASYTSMLDVEPNPFSADASARHTERTANLAGEETEVVYAVMVARAAFFRWFAERGKERLAKMKGD